ncbi:MAG: NAD(P)-dependent oxidoreductase [Methylobacterium sp.]|nr:NAD(P)-dependent oxidoreductase [Methylobacterium sp.]
MILVTGSSGLIGRHLTSVLNAAGFETRPFDIKASREQDVRSTEALEKALDGVEGVVHLAAVSRVITAQRNPDLCLATNVEVLRGLLASCLARPSPPWVLFASSREVYGQAADLPVSEDAPLSPMNVYARSKVAGEQLVRDAREAGLSAHICRFSSVYGCVHDHPDRVVMAFAGAAATGDQMRIEGPSHTFDFTAVNDVAAGVGRLVEAIRARAAPPTIHFASGVGTTLSELAELCARHARLPIRIEIAPPRDFDVSRFVGDPSRAARMLGWRASTPLDQGVPPLIRALAAHALAVTPAT